MSDTNSEALRPAIISRGTLVPLGLSFGACVAVASIAWSFAADYLTTQIELRHSVETIERTLTDLRDDVRSLSEDAWSRGAMQAWTDDFGELNPTLVIPSVH